MKKLLSLLTITTALMSSPVKANENTEVEAIKDKITTYYEEAKSSTLWKDLKGLAKEAYTQIKKEYNKQSTTLTESDSMEKLNSLNRVETLPEVRYNRKDYKHWINLSDGWNIREEVLLVYGTEVEVANNKILSGTWFDYYTNKELKSPKKIDIDHVIPLKLANKMGASNFTPEQKIQFANDLDNLVVTYNRVNRAKSDKGPSEWKPENSESAKMYAEKFVEIAYKYGLTISEADYSALYEMLK